MPSQASLRWRRRCQGRLMPDKCRDLRRRQKHSEHECDSQPGIEHSDEILRLSELRPLAIDICATTIISHSSSGADPDIQIGAGEII